MQTACQSYGAEIITHQLIICRRRHTHAYPSECICPKIFFSGQDQTNRGELTTDGPGDKAGPKEKMPEAHAETQRHEERTSKWRKETPEMEQEISDLEAQLRWYARFGSRQPDPYPKLKQLHGTHAPSSQKNFLLILNPISVFIRFYSVILD